MARLFAAIALDDEARRFAQGVMDRLADGLAPCRFERPEKLHITLAFLGSIPQERVPPFAAALAQAAAGSAPFQLQLVRLGGFPARMPRLLWLGSSVNEPAYAACAARVREEFDALGSHSEGYVEPHVSVCRCKMPLPDVPAIELGGGVGFAVRELTLYESLPDGPTTRYQACAVAPLGG